MARLNVTITLNPGHPVQISSLFNANTAGKHGTPFILDRIFIQMAIGGTGVGYVMTGIPEGVTPSASTSGQISAQLASSGGGTDPGGSYEDRAYEKDGTGIDGAGIWVDGSAADPCIVSVDQR